MIISHVLSSAICFEITPLSAGAFDDSAADNCLQGLGFLGSRIFSFIFAVIVRMSMTELELSSSYKETQCCNSAIRYNNLDVPFPLAFLRPSPLLVIDR